MHTRHHNMKTVTRDNFHNMVSNTNNSNNYSPNQLITLNKTIEEVQPTYRDTMAEERRGLKNFDYLENLHTPSLSEDKYKNQTSPSIHREHQHVIEVHDSSESDEGNTYVYHSTFCIGNAFFHKVRRLLSD